MAARFLRAGIHGAWWGLVFISWLAAAPIAAAGVTVALYPASQGVSPGAEFDLELRVPQAGSKFNGFDAMVSFDPAALTLIQLSPVAIQQGTLMTSACGSTFHHFRAGAGVDTVTDILLCSGVSVTGPGQIYRLHFRASNTPQVTTVRFLPGTVKFYDAGLFVTPVTSSDAQVTIGSSSTAVGDGLASAGPVLTAAPNPSRGSVAFVLNRNATGAETLSVRDLHGRVVRRVAVDGLQFGWDGRRDSGELVPSGVYFATLEWDGRSTTIRVNLIR